MSQSRLSIGRYGTPSVYHAHASDLFTNRNEILNPEETLPKLLADFKRLFEQTQDTTNNLHDTMITCESSSLKTAPVYAQRQLLIARSAYFENLFSEKETSNDDYDLTVEKDGKFLFPFVTIF